MIAPSWAAESAETWNNWILTVFGCTPGEVAVVYGKELWDDVQDGRPTDTKVAMP